MLVFFFVCLFLFIWRRHVLVAACGVWFPDQGLNPGPLRWEHRVLAAGPLGKSLLLVLYGFIFPPAEIHPLVVLTARLCWWEALRLDVKMALFCFLVSGVARGQCFPSLLWKSSRRVP